MQKDPTGWEWRVGTQNLASRCFFTISRFFYQLFRHLLHPARLLSFRSKISAKLSMVFKQQPLATGSKGRFIIKWLTSLRRHHQEQSPGGEAVRYQFTTCFEEEKKTADRKPFCGRDGQNLAPRPGPCRKLTLPIMSPSRTGNLPRS